MALTINNKMIAVDQVVKHLASGDRLRERLKEARLELAASIVKDLGKTKRGRTAIGMGKNTTFHCYAVGGGAYEAHAETEAVEGTFTLPFKPRKTTLALLGRIDELEWATRILGNRWSGSGGARRRKLWNALCKNPELLKSAIQLAQDIETELSK